RTPIALALLLPLATPLAGQSARELCRELGNITVGQWAEYRMSGREGPTEVRFAIVGKEAAAGKDHYWYELKFGSTQGTMIVQALVPGYPYEQNDVQSLVVKMGDQPAMKVPQSMMGMMGQMQQQGGPGSLARDAVRKCETADVVGREAVEVPAGRMQTTHLRSTDGGQTADVWVNTGIPFGMVKMTWGGANSGEMTLLRHGKDAKSSITETPQEMPGMRRP
ncbi:MAG TPA: hypothetical protein VFH97_05700, partial [Gemmatimonadales bacterium]|nr:hypothetical protein [Gemmatimonadales bacterium]